ncbi:MAG: competence/damage-inducible protein A [Saprospiraceae bacterium]|nr:competence/damage-inducible protein A [Saprospiraceae bacterium]
MDAIIITIGDELLIGQVIDTNSAWIGTELNDFGVQVVERISVGDDHEAIIHALEEAVAKSRIILLTGGLGPTKDDITKKAIADFFNDEMVFHNPTWERIQGLFKRWGRETTDDHKEQCYMPSKAELLNNKMGTAPGMLFRHKKSIIVSMPGVPYEMKYIMEHSVFPLIQSMNEGHEIYHRTIRTIGEGESRLAFKINDLVEALPDFIKVAFLPSLGQVRIRLTGRGSNVDQLKKSVDHHVEQISERLKEFVFGFDLETVEEVIGKLARARGVTIGLAESCTGGSISSRIVSVSGASEYYAGGIVSYSNEVKMSVLGVKETTLKDHGAVSEETVIEMALGARKVLGSDIAFSISGIAGPNGGTAEKPVGTVWMACTDGTQTQTYLLKAGKDREKNIIYSGTYGLNLIRKYIMAQ